VWLLIHQVEYFDPGSAFKEAWGDNSAGLYARLRPGVSAAAAQDGLKSTIATLAQARPANFKPAAGAFIAMLAFGLIPAWMVSRRDLIGAMKDGGHHTSHGLARARFRLALVAVQVVGCCALLIVAGSLVRGLQHLLAADPGFAFERVVVLDASLSRHGVDGAAARAYWSDVA
jgi:hypothetical protein